MSVEILKKYLPEGSFEYVSELIKNQSLIIKITNPRQSRLGSFRGDPRTNSSSINISGSLNPYAFLITLIHEIAHMHVFKSYKKKTAPHGLEWKRTYSGLMHPLLNENIFPPDLLSILIEHFKNPKASSLADKELALALRKYDHQEPNPTVQDIPMNGFFQLPNGQTFQRKERKRVRFLCQDIQTKKRYLFNPIAEVIPYPTDE